LEGGWACLKDVFVAKKLLVLLRTSKHCLKVAAEFKHLIN
jgi:hypothetical protein